jgi:hypothetical protein
MSSVVILYSSENISGDIGNGKTHVKGDLDLLFSLETSSAQISCPLLQMSLRWHNTSGFGLETA